MLPAAEVNSIPDLLFDLFDDLEEGINTIVTKFNHDFTPVYVQYLKEVEKLKLSFQKLSYTQKNKDKFMFVKLFSLFVSKKLIRLKEFLNTRQIISL